MSRNSFKTSLLQRLWHLWYFVYQLFTFLSPTLFYIPPHISVNIINIQVDTQVGNLKIRDQFFCNLFENMIKSCGPIYPEKMCLVHGQCLNMISRNLQNTLKSMDPVQNPCFRSHETRGFFPLPSITSLKTCLVNTSQFLKFLPSCPALA